MVRGNTPMRGEKKLFLFICEYKLIPNKSDSTYGILDFFLIESYYSNTFFHMQIQCLTLKHIF